MPKKLEVALADRVEAVLSLLRGEESAASLARRWQVSEMTIYRWRDAFLSGGREGLSKGEVKIDESARRIEQLERELGKRAQIIGELSIANDILKKLQSSRE